MGERLTHIDSGGTGLVFSVSYDQDCPPEHLPDFRDCVYQVFEEDNGDGYEIVVRNRYSDKYDVEAIEPEFVSEKNTGQKVSGEILRRQKMSADISDRVKHILHHGRVPLFFNSFRWVNSLEGDAFCVTTRVCHFAN